VTTVQQKGGDAMAAGAAWGSTDGDAALGRLSGEGDEKAEGVIHYLMRQRHGCISCDTEVFPDQVGKFWAEVSGDELFLTRNLVSDVIEYQKADRIVKRKEDTALVHINTKHLDMLVTGDHNMVAAHRTREGWQPPSLVPAKEALKRSYRIPL